MQERRLLAGGAAVAVLAALAMVAFVLLSPRWAVAHLDAAAQAALGRSVQATGGAHLDFSPLAIRIDGAALSGADAADDSFITAASLAIPVSFGELLRRSPQLSSLTLTGADFAFLINERGEANWDFPGKSPAGPLHLVLEQARLRYFDARNDQSLTLSHIDGAADIGADGGITFSGSAVINSRIVRIDASLKSLARIDADGSPLELALATNDGTATFSGRLSTAKVLSLAGPVSMASSDAGPALRLLGLPIPEAVKIPGGASIDGTLDSAGRAYAIRNATLALGAFRATGDVVADLRAERPKLQASLSADTLWLDPFLPDTGASATDWGRSKLPFALLRDVDAEAGFEAKSLVYRGVATGAARLKATLTAGKLDVAGAANLADGGTASFTLGADTVALPPALSLKLDVQNSAAQPLLGALTGATQITGTGSFNADLAASGMTEEEMAGTLKGTASLSLADGRIAGSDLAGLFIAARQKILAGWSAAPGGTAFTSLGGEATLADGIATLRDARIETPAASITFEGVADILRRGIDLKANALANGQPLLPVAVIARGPWAEPKIYPDIPDILTNPEGGFARLQDPGAVQGN